MTEYILQMNLEIHLERFNIENNIVPLEDTEFDLYDYIKSL